MNPLVPAVALAAALCPARAQEAPAGVDAASYDVVRSELFDDLNPYAAEDFLDGKEGLLQALGQADPAQRDRFLAQATALKDLHHEVTICPTTDLLSRALIPRLSDGGSDAVLPFAAHPSLFAAWKARYADYASRVQAAQAVLEWSALGDERRRFLEGAGVTQDAWEALSYGRRRARLEPWLDRALDDFAAQPPPRLKSSELGVEGRFDDLSAFLSPAQYGRASAVLMKARAAYSSFEKLEASPKVKTDPRLQSLLAQAESSPSLDASLSALKQVFDGAGLTSPALEAQRPPRPEERVTPDVVAALAPELTTALLAQAASVPAGRPLADFYRSHSLVLDIKPLGADRIAQYVPRTDHIEFNETFVEQWLKTEHHTAQELVTRQAVLDDFVELVSPVLVHEADHQARQAWADQNHIEPISGTDLETEAMTREAAFIVEKLRADPRFKAVLEKDPQDSVIKRGSASLANALTRDPDLFEDEVEVGWYDGFDSRDGDTSRALDFYLRLGEAARAEQVRRAALPEAQRQAYASAPHIPAAQALKDFKGFLAQANDADLAAAVAGLARERRATVESYEAIRKRHEELIGSLLSQAVSDAPSPNAQEPPPPAR